MYGRIKGAAGIHGKIIRCGGGGGNLQPSVTVTPTQQTQTLTPGAGYDGLKQVVVEAIPSNYGKISYDGHTLTVE